MTVDLLFHVFETAVSAKTYAPKLDDGGAKSVLNELGLIGPTVTDSHALGEAASKLRSIVLEAFPRLSRDFSWVRFSPYRLPDRQRMVPVVFMHCGNIEWVSQIGSHLVLVTQTDFSPALSMPMGELKATILIRPRSPWEIKSKS